MSTRVDQIQSKDNVTQFEANLSDGMEPKPFLCDLKVCLYLDPAIASGVLFWRDIPLDTGALKTMIWVGAPVPRESGPIINWCDAYKSGTR